MTSIPTALETGAALPAAADLSSSEVYVVRLPLAGAADSRALRDTLDARERDRADRLVHQTDRRLFIAAHALMREVLGRCLRQPPGAIRIETARHGKPRLADQSIGLHFNLSHTGDIALLALARDREVGIDVERHRPIDALKMSRRFFSSAEHEALCRISPRDRLRAFYRGWTRKESFVKAIGCGLGSSLRDFDVSLAGRGTQMLQGRRGACATSVPWTILPLAVPVGHTAALTAAGYGWRVSYRTAPTLDV